jgi:5-enolpyruvylshikimate-3-phosphate synthase
VDIDMVDISDTAQTLAAVATFADTPTQVRMIGFIRGKEIDCIGLLVAELRRCGRSPNCAVWDRMSRSVIRRSRCGARTVEE